MASPKELNNAVLVIGGGIAGIQSSLDLANLGFNVYLVEKRPTIGGVMAQLDKLYPSMENSLYQLTPKMGDVLENPNIELLTYSEVTNVDGSAGDFTVTILQHPRFVDGTKCDACDICATVCPMVTVDIDFNIGLGKRKAAYTPFTQAVPKTYVIDKGICLYFNNKMCQSCQKLCPKGAINFDQEPVERQVDVNAIIVATGALRNDISNLSKYGYDFENVLTGLEFERILTSNGPTEGQILRISDRQIPETIAFITLDSSTSQKAVAIKQSIESKEKNPSMECLALMDGTLEDGEEFAPFIQRSIADGVNYIDGIISAVEEDPDSKDLIIRYKDKNSKETKELKVNMVVLFDQLLPSKEGMAQLASVLGLKLTKKGFFSKKSKSEPVETKKTGVFAIGAGLQPEDVSLVLADVNAVVSKIISEFAPPELWTPKAFVETDYCIGCGYCREACPFYAISLEVVELELPVAEVAGIPLKTRKAQVHESLCRGCGICVSECPVQAIRYGDPQTLEQVLSARVE